MNSHTAHSDSDLYRLYRNWSTGLGIALIILGIATISLSAFTTLVTVLILGFALIIRGVIDVWHAIATREEEGFWPHLFGGVISFVVGLLVAAQPTITAAALTLLIAAWLVASGLFRTIAAPFLAKSHRGWIIASGIVELLLGAWVFSGWPVISLWLIGLLIGVEFLVQGVVMLSVPYATKSIQRRVGQPVTH